MGLNVIGDELHYDGYLVGILVSTGVPASVFGPFVDELANGTIFEVEDTDVPMCAECKVEPKHKKDCSHFEDKCGPTPRDHMTEYECAMDDIIRSLGEFNKGGLVRWADIVNTVKQLNEEGDVDETDAS